MDAAVNILYTLNNWNWDCSIWVSPKLCSTGTAASCQIFQAHAALTFFLILKKFAPVDMFTGTKIKFEWEIFLWH